MEMPVDLSSSTPLSLGSLGTLRGNIRNDKPWKARHCPGVEVIDWSGDHVEAIAPVTWQSLSNTMNGLRQEKNTGVRSILIGKMSVSRRRHHTKSGWAFRGYLFKEKQGDTKGYFHNTLSKSRSIRMTPGTEASRKEHSEPIFRWDPDPGRHPHRTRFYLRCAKLPSCCNAWARPHSPSTSIHLLHEGHALDCVLDHVSLSARCTHRCATGAPTAVSL